MKYIKKLDKWLFDVISHVVVGWVKKKKFAQHKYDFFLMVHDYQIAYFVAVIFFIVSVDIYKHHVQVGVIAAITLTVLLGFSEGMRRMDMLDSKKKYDIIFVHRKNPEMYNLVKELNQHLYERGWQYRRWVIPLTILFLVYVISNHPPFVAPIFLFNIAQLYESYIFDFDEPEKKEKKQKDSVTDIIMGSWKNLIGTLAPGNS